MSSASSVLAAAKRVKQRPAHGAGLDVGGKEAHADAGAPNEVHSSTSDNASPKRRTSREDVDCFASAISDNVSYRRPLLHFEQIRAYPLDSSWSADAPSQHVGAGSV